MISKSTFTFLNSLKKNNTKEWFDANRKTYETERKQFIDFTRFVLNEIVKFDASVAGLDPAKCVFRINRDVRFSANKDPYKTNFAFSITPGGKKKTHAGYYFHLEPGTLFAGGGVYAPLPEVLKVVRNEIYFCLPEFEKIMKSKSFLAHFKGLDDIEKLKNAPKGFEPDHASIPYLVNKHFVVSRSYTEAEVTSPDFGKKLAEAFKAQKPFVDFINRAIDNAEE